MECQNFMFLTVAHNDRMYGNDDGTILRRHSMPSSPFRLSLSSNDIRNPLHDDILRRVRSFKTTSKGVINRGDILRKRNSLISSGCQVTDFDIGPGLLNRVRIPSTTSQGSEPGLSLTSSGAPSCYRIMVLGSSGVGKSALIKQFMSSENSVGIDDSNVLDNTISVILDDEESLLEFCNYPDDQYPEEDINVDAYVVVFSINDQSTYDYAVHLMKYLRNVIGTDRSILVVANKTDLVRNRTVERKDARLTATCYNCKYAETSATLNHQVDDLLVGILSQIRLKLNPDKLLEHMERTGDRRLKNRHGSLKSAKSIIHKLFNRQKSLSCDNLYDL